MRFDLHIHTKYSRCLNQEPADILKRAKKIGLDGIAVLDHNTTKGSKEAKRLNKDKDFTVIIAEEINTSAS